MKQVKFDFDTTPIQETLRIGGQEGLFAAAHDLAGESLKQVPIDESTLEKSLAVDVQEDVAVISYDTPYAVRMHEHPEYNFQRGRKGKYLEDPVNDASNWQRILNYLVEKMKL